MASILYREGLADTLGGTVDWDTDTIRVRPVADEDYTAPSGAGLDITDMSTVTGYTGATDATVTVDITTSKGIVDMTDLSPAYSSLSQDAAKDIDGLVIFKFVTNDAGSTPLCYIDLTTPFTPNGGDVNIQWNASGVISLRKDS